MIKLFTDTTANIPLDLQVEYNITVFPLRIVIDGREHMESEINTSNLYKSIQKNRETPESKPLKMDFVYSAFEEEILKNNKVIAVFLSSSFSETYKNAEDAARKLRQKYPQCSITVIDSLTCGMEEGLAVLAAADKIKEGSWLEDAINAAKESKKYTRFMMMPERLRFLEFEGRVSKQQAIVGDMIHLNPIVTARDGKVELMEKSHTQHRAIERALEIMKGHIRDFGIKKLVVHHIDDFDKAMETAQKAEEIAGIEAMVTELGPGLGIRFGPGTIGLVYQTEKEIIDREA